MLTFIDFFAGIGGFRLGLERAGMRCVAAVERDPFVRKVYAKNFGHEPEFSDIRDVRPGDLPAADLWCGGFPCQDLSLAGAREGLEGDRSGLWWVWRRLVALVRPRILLVENVPGLLTRPSADAFFGSLAEIGYDAEWQVVSAADVGAPHLRERVWVVATPTDAERVLLRDEPRRFGGEALAGDDGAARDVAHPVGELGRARGFGDTEQGARGRDADRGGLCEDVADAHGVRELQPSGAEWQVRRRTCHGGQAVVHANRPGFEEQWESESESEKDFAAQCRSWWGIEPPVGRVVDGIPHRVAQLRGLGNAVVPHVVHWVGRRIRREFDRV